MSEKRSSFSSSLGFVIAAAGSAVGLGNIWRFPYLAAKDGGGIFLVTYLILALTFGFTLLITEISIGRKTKQSPLTAYGILHPKWKGLGIIAVIVPFMILPYYCIIGGWVLKYFVTFVTGNGLEAAEDGYFGGFITDIGSPIIYNIIFLAATVFVIYKGVNKGIEAMSKILMPILLVLVIGVAIFSLTINSKETGRTGLEGFMVYVVPDVSGMGIKDFFVVIMDAMGQLFYSISVAMGIMVAYGSYFKDDHNLVKSVNQIEIFDTLVAFLAGIMIIPAVYVFMGKEGMTGGPGLMFVAIPKVFAEMGKIGNVLGAVFFLMVLFAALTSSISVLEAVVSSLMDQFKVSRRKATIMEGVIALVLGVVICLGYNKLYFDIKLPNGSNAQLLDIFDYISNNILMPIVAIGTCILIGWVVKPKTVIDEATKNGEKFGRRKLYIAMIKVVAPILLFILLLGAFGVFS
ncbi:MAG: sodium-dependent transporter [Lachnospiraceae bacterium]|nr:sodium-dependent transporter [Lachnospiraceae bacterium]